MSIIVEKNVIDCYIYTNNVYKIMLNILNLKIETFYFKIKNIKYFYFKIKKLLNI